MNTYFFIKLNNILKNLSRVYFFDSLYRAKPVFFAFLFFALSSSVDCRMSHQREALAIKKEKGREKTVTSL